MAAARGDVMRIAIAIPAYQAVHSIGSVVERSLAVFPDVLVINDGSTDDTGEAAKKAGYQLKVGKFPFTASGKAKAAGASDGFVKLIFDAKYGELLGAHMIGANVTEMIAEIVAIRKLETTGHEIIKTVHPHPTRSEAIMEAAAAAYGEVIHL